MKIAIINTYSNGSTGTIAEFIGSYAEHKGDEVFMFYGRNKTNKAKWEFIGETKLGLFFSNGLTYLTGNIGSFHYFSTMKLLRRLKNIKPDVIHIHNIHGNYINFKIFGKYLSKFKGKVIFTLHDEFLLTGRCALCFCDKWEHGCEKCKHLSAYPRALIDKSKKMQKQKYNMLSKIQNLHLVAPSKWLKSYIDKSMLKNFKCTNIYNGLESPHPEEFDISNIIEPDKINLCFSAFTWSVDKGALIIKEIARNIDKTRFNIIVVGYNKYCKEWFDFECKKIELLPRNRMIYLLKYVDVLVNPTFKDNLPTILIESLQVGTPVITFDTGGCSEIIDSECGYVIMEKTAEKTLEAINNFNYKKRYCDICREKSKKFSLSKMANSYLKIYKE